MADDADLTQERHERYERLIFGRRQAVKANSEAAPYCLDCGEVISDARRKAVPQAKRCLTCQETIERTSWMHS